MRELERGDRGRCECGVVCREAVAYFYEYTPVDWIMAFVFDCGGGAFRCGRSVLI